MAYSDTPTSAPMLATQLLAFEEERDIYFSNRTRNSALSIGGVEFRYGTVVGVFSEDGKALNEFIYQILQKHLVTHCADCKARVIDTVGSFSPISFYHYLLSTSGSSASDQTGREEAGQEETLALLDRVDVSRTFDTVGVGECLDEVERINAVMRFGETKEAEEKSDPLTLQKPSSPTNTETWRERGEVDDSASSSSSASTPEIVNAAPIPTHTSLIIFNALSPLLRSTTIEHGIARSHALMTALLARLGAVARSHNVLVIVVVAVVAPTVKPRANDEESIMWRRAQIQQQRMKFGLGVGGTMEYFLDTQVWVSRPDRGDGVRVMKNRLGYLA